MLGLCVQPYGSGLPRIELFTREGEKAIIGNFSPSRGVAQILRVTQRLHSAETATSVEANTR